ncbi:MAG: hypothetical protein AB4290_11075, partial [Spirulina sp.]
MPVKPTHLLSAISIALCLNGFNAYLTCAQIVESPSDTGTTVTPHGDRFDISGGSLSGNGANLFHSFEQF